MYNYTHTALKRIIIAIFILFSCLSNAQEFKTVTYYANDTLKLELDLFLPKNTAKEKLPLLIHVHGGGFSGGERSNGHHIASYAAENGYAAASISYSLYMKGKNFSCDGTLTEKIKAIQIASNQLQQVVVFFLENKEKYNIDSAKIFISGSSAGAETVLHAAFWKPEMMSMYPGRLPDGFRYAGIIEGAGAIMDLNLITKDTMMPILGFHGSCDRIVPYGTAAHHYCPAGSSGWLMLFGSHSIYEHTLALGGDMQLLTYCGGGHEYSDELFAKGQQEIIDFMDNVLKGTVQPAHTTVATGKDCILQDAYDFCK